MHPIDAFRLYNLLAGSLTMAGFVYLLTRNRAIGAYHRYVHVLLFGLLIFAVGGPVVDLLAPTWSHAVHTVAAIIVIYGLYNPVQKDLRRDSWANLVLQNPSRIRYPGEWMVPMDDEVLELFHSTEIVLTPSIIAYNTGYSREEVNRRLRELSEYDLVERVERGKYRITELGENYLAGDCSASGVNPGTELALTNS